MSCLQGVVCLSRVSLLLIEIFAMWKAGRWSYLLPGGDNVKEEENHNTSSADVSEIVQEEEVDHMEKAAVKSDSDSEDDKPIVEQILRNQKKGTSRGINRNSTVGKKAGVRCAERGESSILLWQHEFYYVLEREEVMGRKQAPPKPYLYQAIEFRKGIELPLEEKEGLSRKQLGEMWVQGVAYAPALNVRMYSSREKGYLFHTKYNDADARSGLFWRCPEVVRIDNSKAWRAMSKVLTTIPRVVHPDDVYSGAVHVAGRDLHYVCGMCAHENVGSTYEKLKEGPWGFVCKKIIREEDGVEVNDGFCMYPEERLGMYLNSASMMWAMVDDVFEGVRRVMRDNGRARSGSLSMKWSATMQQFWQVIAQGLVFLH